MATRAPRSPGFASPAEYRAWEEQQEERYEFVYHELVMMTGATLRHNDITLNIAALLRDGLRRGPCRVNTSDVKALLADGRWAYPDVIVQCGLREPSATGLEDAVVIVEVLSKSTEKWDLEGKRWPYLAIPTLRHLVYVAQDRAKVEVASRIDEAWRSVFLTNLEDVARLDTIGVELPLAAIYEDVGLDPVADVAGG